MGGEDSGVSEATTDVMLEIAYFTPDRIAQTGQKLGSDQRRPQPLRARGRPGLPRRRAGDPDRADPRHLRRRGVRARSTSATPPVEDRTVSVRSRSARSHLAASRWPEDRPARDPRNRSASPSPTRPTSRVPTWRRDVTAPPIWSRRSRGSPAMTRSPRRRSPRQPGVAKPTATRSQLIERDIRRAAAARGLDEAVTWSFISEQEAEQFRRRRLARSPIRSARR